MVPTGLGHWKMEPSDQDLTRFLRVKKQKLLCRPVAALVAPGTVAQIGTTAKNVDSDSAQGYSATVNGSYPTVTNHKGKAPEKTVFIDKPETSEAPPQFDPISSSDSKETTNPLHYDFLLEGLLTEWRTRREKLVKGETPTKLSSRSFFPQQHNQIKYWAWPFFRHCRINFKFASSTSC